ncbi:dipicolinate synthase subunit DpsA [Caldicellulosiruptor naganoensis]|uniref:Dipicolinate synthase subunit DpsA n=1 Tax=Caldicellulosiruptor naganoensis TaxID=29324 RepID=A0ABY7BKY4_9FIRM|nr:dipicolinate synthase subunit DpsA [Caldicellulosiruptor naganoensis]WAM32552.1 dipicolinate synthase subunit DpsA [Caldicellulosiruptor naganoensis]
MEEIVEKSAVIVGPIPFSQDGEYIFAPLSKEFVTIEKLIKTISQKGIPLVASVVPQATRQICEQKNVKYYDLYEREELAILNAIPTAEGAVAIAIEKMPITLYSSNVMVLGYGRIGKVLSKILKGFECNVFVAARKASDLTWCRAFGYVPVELSKLKEYVNRIDLIVNTIPAKVIGREIIDNIREDALVIDLASKPGGIAFEYANQKGINVVHALSLPGKVSPKKAAQYIVEVLVSLLKELEGDKIES